MKKLSLILFSVVLLFAGCRKDKIVVTETIYLGEEPEVLINTSITGVVIDENGQPIEGATVQLKQHGTATDDNGFFYMKDILANENGAVIEVEKSGYFPTSKMVFPNLNEVEFVRIKLIESNESGLVSSNSGGVITLAGGAQIEFPADAFELNGAAYGGQVAVHATYIDPLADDLFERMPGSLLGVDANGQIMGMTTFGMIGVEIFSNSGEELELNSDKKATLTFPVPAEIIGEAPSEIALWHYDEELGYWMEEGRAELHGSTYIASVSHFSFWNCDDPFPTVLLEGRAVNSGGEGVGNVQVQLKRNTQANQTGTAFTGPAGYFSGKVPKDEVLEMKVFDLCGNLISSTSVGPFSTDTKLNDIIVDLPVNVNFTGALIDCQGSAVEKGYVKVYKNDDVFGYLIPDADGNINASVSFCEEGDFKVQGIDIKNSQASDERSLTFKENIDLGTISACGTVIPTLLLELAGTDYIFSDVTASVVEDTSYMPPKIITTISAVNGSGYFSIGIDGEGTGNFEVIRINAQVGTSSRILSDPRIDVEITRFDGPGGFISGTFEGIVYDVSGGMDINLSGSFNAERD
ncbi:MAG: carboxypeptidase regulatory-like domain-containing protein [Saprospiraceae bacterium]|nr:carboxypeptidase regulatory-like domain-containing protein [Saprospiraceae bacterium]